MRELNEYEQIFNLLKNILSKYRKKMNLTEDNANSYVLVGPFSEKFKRDLWFGAVLIKKNYVSYHLVPIYIYKNLAKEIPASLKKKMQGKSCFNFNKVDKHLFKQLELLTDKAFNMFIKFGDKIPSDV